MKKLLFILMAALIAPVVNAEEIVLESATCSLHGTLEMPESSGPPPLVLIIPGSGPTDRDGNIRGFQGKNNSLKYLAEALSRNGVASLRFDKRGVGRSVSSQLREEYIKPETYIDDVTAWMDYLRSRDNFHNLFILGHSEGSLIGMAAAQRGGVNGFISISGAGRSAPEIIIEQTRTQLPSDLMRETERIIGELKAGRMVKSPPPSLNLLFRESAQPYLISWFKYEPAKEMAKLDIPVLIVQGTTDIQVTVDDAKRLHEAGRKSRLIIIEGMNHVLKHVPNDSQKQLASYGDPSLPVSEELVNVLLKFIKSSESDGPDRVAGGA
jgi:alpha-beta hydrolase superfamily lysophospholipase